MPQSLHETQLDRIKPAPPNVDACPRDPVNTMHLATHALLQFPFWEGPSMSKKVAQAKFWSTKWKWLKITSKGPLKFPKGSPGRTWIVSFFQKIYYKHPLSTTKTIQLTTTHQTPQNWKHKNQLHLIHRIGSSNFHIYHRWWNNPSLGGCKQKQIPAGKFPYSSSTFKFLWGQFKGGFKDSLSPPFGGFTRDEVIIICHMRYPHFFGGISPSPHHPPFGRHPSSCDPRNASVPRHCAVSAAASASSGAKGSWVSETPKSWELGVGGSLDDFSTMFWGSVYWYKYIHI